MLVDLFYDEKAKSTIIELREDLVMNVMNEVVTIPASFRSDGCSCPEFLWRIL